jgi:catechol 2,3-dioxygenase-like lactoylglutathione lyase family enzyme
LVGGAAVAASSGKEDVMLQDSPIYAYFPATDVPRARAFYEKKLGLKPKEEVAGGVVYEFGKGTAAFLYETPNAGTSKASQAFWDVPDVDRTVAALRERGVVFERYDDLPGKRSADGYVVEAGGAKAAWFKDPDGNILAVIQSVGEKK